MNLWKLLFLIIPCNCFTNNIKKGLSSVLVGSTVLLNPIQEDKPVMNANIEYIDKYENSKYENNMNSEKTYVYRLSFQRIRGKNRLGIPPSFGRILGDSWHKKCSFYASGVAYI